MRVRLQVSREFLEQMLCLGDRRIVDVAFAFTEYGVEPTALVEFAVDAPDAPEGTTRMEPILQRSADGTVTMLDPGWTSR